MRWTGRINDIYLARKEKYGRIHLFAFIRYTTKGGALKAIKEMNGMRLRSKEIFVGEAKYRRRIDVREKITTHDEDVRQSLDRKQEKIKEKDIEMNEKERVVLEHHRSEELKIQREPLELGWDAVVMMPQGLREAKHDKDKKVFAIEDLDEWHEDFLKTRTDNPLVYLAVTVNAESMDLKQSVTKQSL